MLKYFLLIVLLLIFGVGALFYQHKEETIPYPASILSYEDCLQAKDSKRVTSFPNKCETNDGVVFFETIKDPVDTSDWKVVDTSFGYSIKCPPYWSCSKYANGFTVEPSYYYVDSINFGRISSSDFKESFIRHPKYTNPSKWLSDVLAKKADAIKVYDSAIINVEGTSERIPRAYYGTDYEKIKEIQSPLGKGVIMPREGNSVFAVLPLTNNSVITVFPFEQYSEHPIVKALISSISLNPSVP